MDKYRSPALEAIRDFNRMEQGEDKAKAIHAVATLWMKAARRGEVVEENMVLFLGERLGVTAEEMMEFLKAGFADMGVRL